MDVTLVKVQNISIDVSQGRQPRALIWPEWNTEEHKWHYHSMWSCQDGLVRVQKRGGLQGSYINLSESAERAASWISGRATCAQSRMHRAATSTERLPTIAAKGQKCF